MHRNFNDLLDAILSAGTDSQIQALGKLLKVYNDALNNPPQGVIGVGAITYAQGALANAQVEK